jgi:hypothetical protein
MAGLDTYDKLRTGIYELWEQRDDIFEEHERAMGATAKEAFENKFGYDSGEDDWRENYKYIYGTEESGEDVVDHVDDPVDDL